MATLRRSFCAACNQPVELSASARQRHDDTGESLSAQHEIRNGDKQLQIACSLQLSSVALGAPQLEPCCKQQQVLHLATALQLQPWRCCSCQNEQHGALTGLALAVLKQAQCSLHMRDIPPQHLQCMLCVCSALAPQLQCTCCHCLVVMVALHEASIQCCLHCQHS